MSSIAKSNGGATADDGTLKFLGFMDIPSAGVVVSQASAGAALGSFTMSSPSEFARVALTEAKASTPLESMMVAQMAVCNSHVMSAFSKATDNKADEASIKWLKIADKLMRTYTTAMEAYSRVRREVQQKVRVEHVHVNEGGQALIGNVAGPGAEPR